MKLNLGSGGIELGGFINVDRKKGQEAYPLVSYADSSVDEIRASHILEHFEYGKLLDVLRNWVSKLKVGGVLKIAVPDFSLLAKEYGEGKALNYNGYILGGQIDKDDYHKSIFDKGSLSSLFEKVGLTDIREWKSEVQDCASLPISLNLMGTKTGKGSKYDVNAQIAAKSYNKYSQFGEDGIIEEIFNLIGTENKWCFECGAADGIFFSNTRNLIEKGWTGVLVEDDKQAFERLKLNSPSSILENLHLEPCGANSVDSILAKHNAPKDIDLAIIDVDGQDYHIWNGMLKYHPRVIVIEFAMSGDKARYVSDDFIPTVGGEGQAGKAAILRLASSKQYTPIIQTDCNVICVRSDIALKLYNEEIKPQVEEKEVKVKISAVMSLPRLMFTDNVYCVVESFYPLGINMKMGTGVFWGQILTRMLEEQVDAGVDYVFVCDYDTMFTKEHVHRLCQLMIENPIADAIVPLQVKRENDSVMFSAVSSDTWQPVEKMLRDDFKKDLIPIQNGHFGLTIFKADIFRKLQKPWFLGIPDKDNGWNDGRTDDDIYFWQNFRKCGFHAYLAPNVKIGHIQLGVTFPGKVEDNWKPVHYYVTDVKKGIYPDDYIPKLEVLK